MKILLAKLLSILHILMVYIPFTLRTIFYNETKYDVYILVFVLLMRLHWYFFKGECILSYFGKKLVIPNYKIGDDIFSTPFMDLFYKENKISKNMFSAYYKDFIENLGIFVILFTNIKSENFNLILVLSLTSIILLMCYTNLYRDHLKKRLSQNKDTITDLVVFK
jgi:hypothetical protein